MIHDRKRNVAHTALKIEWSGGRHVSIESIAMILEEALNKEFCVFIKDFMTEYSASSKVEAAISKHLADEEEGKQW